MLACATTAPADQIVTAQTKRQVMTEWVDIRIFIRRQSTYDWHAWIMLPISRLCNC
jgi:hypothetical protein